ncbi:MAG: pantoate--beta-alanine ligase [Bacteriovoracaceae bacterium]|nr:pantoate--beta-alanine ligase [Bacteriovoracaceae bacterium]
MKIFENINEWKKFRKEHPSSMGFVPTMGALHDGHLSLIKHARRENEKVIVSIFVNPTQFNDPCDLDNYPVDLDRDIASLKELEVDYLFLPTKKSIYPEDYNCKVIENNLGRILCGKTRTGHFDGVLTVVMKLFNIVGPSRAYFGEKDYQQLSLIKKMAANFFMDVEVIGCPIIREADGLAMSSRNVLLDKKHRCLAPWFYKILKNTESIDLKKRKLEEIGFKVDYLEKHDSRLYGAVFLNEVRLIDNVKL